MPSKKYPMKNLKCNIGKERVNPSTTLRKLKLALLYHQNNDEARVLLQKYKQVFSNKPGVAMGVLHKIDTGDAAPIAVTPYRAMGPYVAKVRKELDEMLKEKKHHSFF